MIEIGRVKFVQIQTVSLKVGEKANRIYDPAAIRRMDTLKLSPEGVLGIDSDGREVIDVHHIAHPRSKNGGDNGISIGFTSHYVTIAARFGQHITEGIAGENIIIEAGRSFTYDGLSGQIAFRSSDSEDLIIFDRFRDAAPCVEFSTFCAGRPLNADEMKQTLQFLGDGKRGFYVHLDEATTNPCIRAGDRFFLLDS